MEQAPSRDVEAQHYYQVGDRGVNRINREFKFRPVKQPEGLPASYELESSGPLEDAATWSCASFAVDYTFNLAPWHKTARDARGAPFRSQLS